MKKFKKIPDFKTEDEEREFWDNHDSTDYLDWENAERYKFVNLKPSTETISLRLSRWLLDSIKFEAHKKNIPYQSYIKVILSEKFK